MQTALTLNPSHGDHSSSNWGAIPVDQNEYNEEISQYLSQLHQQQMRQQVQNSSSVKVPGNVQQALNLNIAFLNFSQRLVENLIAQQIECSSCQRMHEDWLLQPSSSDLRVQVLGATNSLDEMVDAHVGHTETNRDEYRLAKLSVTATLQQLQASQRLQSQMEDIAKKLWGPKEPFQSVELSNKEMLHLEWKVVESALKTLYQHYLYFSKCVEAAEEYADDLDREASMMRVDKEKEKFNRTVSLLNHQYEQQKTDGEKSLEITPNKLKWAMKVPSSNSNIVHSPNSQPWKAGSSSEMDANWDKINIPTIQTPKQLVLRNAEPKYTSQMAQEACNRLLESLSSLNVDENPRPAPSILSFSETESSSSYSLINASESSKEQSLPQERDTLSRLSQSWVSLTTDRSLVNSKNCAEGEVEDATGSPSESNKEKGKGKAADREQQPSTKFLNKRFAKGSDRQDGEDEEDENEENNRDRKPQKFDLSADPRGFACPYFQRDPSRYTKLKSCFATPFRNVHRLKEHLYRNHQIPIHCARCRQTFKKEDDMLRHLVIPVACEVKTEPVFEGFDKVQNGQLRSRKQTAKGESEKWKEVYRILFPRDDESLIPSPYRELPGPLIDSNDPLFKQRVREELVDYDKHQRLMLPVLIQSKLDVLKSDDSSAEFTLTRVIEDCLSEVLKDFQLSSELDEQPDESEEGFASTAGGVVTYDEGWGQDVDLEDCVQDEALFDGSDYRLDSSFVDSFDANDIPPYDGEPFLTLEPVISQVAGVQKD